MQCLLVSVNVGSSAVHSTDPLAKILWRMCVIVCNFKKDKLTSNIWEGKSALWMKIHKQLILFLVWFVVQFNFIIPTTKKNNFFFLIWKISLLLLPKIIQKGNSLHSSKKNEKIFKIVLQSHCRFICGYFG